MKLSLIAILIILSMAACAKKEYPAPPPAPGTVELEHSYGTEVRTVKMENEVTCYVVTRDGNNAISCLRL